MIFNFLREFSLMKFMIENFEIYFDTFLNRFQRETKKKIQIMSDCQRVRYNLMKKFNLYAWQATKK